MFEFVGCWVILPCPTPKDVLMLIYLSPLPFSLN